MKASARPQPFPVRKVGDRKWEVLIADRDTWLPCETEHDARIVARAPVLEYESVERTRTGPVIAAELEQVADALAKHGMGFGARFLHRRAAKPAFT